MSIARMAAKLRARRDAGIDRLMAAIFSESVPTLDLSCPMDESPLFNPVQAAIWKSIHTHSEPDPALWN